VFVSVVIPTYNRKPILEKCLKALETQVFTDSKVRNYEVLVVDDGSTDGTREWLTESQGLFPHVQLLSMAHSGPAAARNLGIEKAQGDTIVFIDSDLVVTETFLQSHADCLVEGQKKTEQRSLIYLWQSDQYLQLQQSYQ